MSEWKETDIGNIPSNWDYGYLLDIASKEKKAIISGPFGSNISRKYFVDKGVPVIRGNNLSLNIGQRFIDNNFVYVTEDKAEDLNAWATVDDLVFTAAGTIGQVGIIAHGQKYRTYIISNKQLRITVDPSKMLPIFAYYWFASSFMQNWIASCDTGSTIPLINLTVLKSLPVPVPPLPEQRAIASVLSSLDTKIDLLHRQNKTLEAMAETLFRQWFVEEEGEGWGEGVLHDVISVKGGTTPSTKKSEYWDGDIYWTSPRDLSNHTSVFIFDTKRKITERGLAKIGSGLLPIGTVLLSSRAPIGYLAITEIPLAINQGYIAIVCDKVVSNYFIYLWCKANMEEIQNLGNGSVFQEIAKSVFKEISITIPPPPLLEDFDKTVNPVFSKIKTNQQQIRTLEKLRDTLLPKLMGGEVRIQYRQETTI